MGLGDPVGNRVEQSLGERKPLALAAPLHTTAALRQCRLGIQGIQQVQQPWRSLAARGLMAGSSPHPCARH